MVRAATLPEPSRRAEQAGWDRRRRFVSTVLDGCLYHPSTSSGSGFINTQCFFERGYSPDHFRQFSSTRNRLGNEEHVAWGQQSPERAFQPIHRRVLDGDTFAVRHGFDVADLPAQPVQVPPPRKSLRQECQRYMLPNVVPRTDIGRSAGQGQSERPVGGRVVAEQHCSAVRADSLFAAPPRIANHEREA